MKDLVNAFIDSLKSSGLQSAALSVAEATLDDGLNDGLLRDIPILGVILGLRKLGIGIRERLFAERMRRIMANVALVPYEERAEFTSKLDDADRGKLGETILGALAVIERTEKADIIGRLFRAHITQQFDFVTFSRMVSKVCTRPLADFETFEQYYYQGMPITDWYLGDELIQAGLIRGTSGHVGSHSQVRSSPPDLDDFEPTPLGVLIASHGLLS